MDYVKNEVKLRRELHQIPELGWGEFWHNRQNFGDN